jgi:hypothetical protein
MGDNDIIAPQSEASMLAMLTLYPQLAEVVRAALDAGPGSQEWDRAEIAIWEVRS